MTSKNMNVLFISVDALRHDRLSVNGYGRPTSPVLEDISGRALVCQKNYAVNASTMGAFPTILTSSQPLSCGGFDTGAVGRPATAIEHFSDNGYETYLLSTIHWVNRFHGYDRGVDHEQFLFPLNSLVGAAAALMRSPLIRFAAGELDEAATVEAVEPVVMSLFDQVEDYCRTREGAADTDRIDLKYAPVYRDLYDFRRVMRVIARHRRDFVSDKTAYLRRYLSAHPKAHEWIARDWRNCRKPVRLVEEFYYLLTNALLRPFDPRLAYVRARRYKRYADAHAIIDRILRTIEERDNGRPFFMWTHLFDTHLPYCPGANPRWYRRAGDYLGMLGYDRDIDPGITFGRHPQTPEGWACWSALYDAAIRYVDEEIGRLVSELRRLGVLDRTLIVICGDHGEELGEHKDISHHFRLYEHNVRVPLMFFHPDLRGTRIDGFTTLLDAAPSMAAIANLQPNPGWEGRPVTSAAVGERRHVLMETFYGSPCDFAGRPLYFALRKGPYKLLWKEYRDPADTLSPEGNELYDVDRDPLEQNNLFQRGHPALPDMLSIIAERMAELPSIDDERISRNFGAIGVAAVKRVRGRHNAAQG